MSSNIAIKIENLSKTYQIYSNPIDRLKQSVSKNRKFYREYSALSNINMEIVQGETVGIIGRNGSGKSTLLQLIVGTLTPSEGNIKANGRIAALLELGSGFNPEFTGRENIFMNGAILGLSKDEMHERFQEIVDFADIGDFIDQPVKTYSSGMYVRLAFAVAVNVNPDILIVDEALAVGDGRFQLKCFEHIKNMRDSGKTILLVTHDMQSIRQFCDRAYLINNGELVASGSPNEMVNEYTKILYDNEISNANSDSEFKGANNEKKIVKEFRYGSQEGTIKDIVLNGIRKRNKFVFTTGDQLDISMVVKANKIIEKPIFAMTIKNIKGVEVYGTNSYYQDVEFLPMDVNEELEVQFSQELCLMPGDYFISFGFVEMRNGETIPLDRRYDSIQLEIFPAGKDRSFGIANLKSNISISKLFNEESILAKSN
jgi:ABC-type polysaccharide/polyol phosphate transport system ATPase subunit